MSFLNINSFHPDNHGWLVANLKKETMDKLWVYANATTKDVSYDLAGNISHSRQLEDKDNWFFLKVLIPLINQYEDEFKSCAITQMTKNHPWILDRFWINYQRENEFNPFHDHTGLYSFVIWMKIPTYSEEQHNSFASKRCNTPKASDFDFHYTDILGQNMQQTYLMNPEMEGAMLFFPASLSHQVYPFYDSDEERISISGNVALDSYTIMEDKR